MIHTTAIETEIDNQNRKTTNLHMSIITQIIAKVDTTPIVHKIIIEKEIKDSLVNLK